MILPNPPTDNLYKFIAITGIVLLVLSLAFPLMKEQELYMERNKYIMEKDILEAESKRIDSEFDANTKMYELVMKNIEKHLNTLDKYTGKKSMFQLTEKEIEKDLVGVEKQLAKLNESLDKKRELLKSAIELKHKNELINYLSNRLKTLKIVSYVGIGLGAILTISGFLLWYRKLQVFQDNIIKKDYEK